MNEVFFVLSRNERTVLFSKYEDIFQCPICRNAMTLVNQKSFICSNNHCFDLNKKGYVNLLTHSLKTKYDKAMFEARKAISAKGFFEPLLDRICVMMASEQLLTDSQSPIKILDAGCGEGSHLTYTLQKLIEKADREVFGVGIDIAKEGITIASRGVSDTVWCVGDLAKSPFSDKSFHFILNILSPANYSEFHRMLDDEGMVVKVIPERKYLQELRAILYKQSDRSIYSNEHTIEHFKRNFNLVDFQHVQYRVTMEHEDIEKLVHMTPLSWGAPAELVQQALAKNKLEITFDFSIMLGRK
ncbi:methyltransferase domain-containing protein [Paenibacillus camelliae]|nr:methyltransferase domain-containing protein [Paenibacillus camelliae]